MKTLTTLMVIGAAHVALTGLHKSLDFIKAHTKEKWPEKALQVVDFLQTTVEWIMGSRQRDK